MSLRSGLLAAAVVVLSSAPAFAGHRHRHWWHPHVSVGHLVIPLPVPHVIPVPVPVVAPVVIAQAPPPPVVYVEDDFSAPPMVVAQPVPVAPAPVVVAAPVPVPVPVPAPAPVAVAAPVVVAQPVVVEDPVKRVALKYAPGMSAVLDMENRELGPASFTNVIGAEFRISRYFALVGGVELRQGARSWQIPGLKVTLFPSSRVHPFASASLALNQVDGQPSNRFSLGVLGAAGLEINVFRWLFLTAEARYAVTPGNCCALPRVGGLVGVGVQFF
ncbi:MAG: hypothetical protein JNK82_22090 [Myxococcaceae bacterium]|nr:hypothetical protein [Myxococcaceae bacterium]